MLWNRSVDSVKHERMMAHSCRDRAARPFQPGSIPTLAQHFVYIYSLSYSVLHLPTQTLYSSFHKFNPRGCGEHAHIIILKCSKENILKKNIPTITNALCPLVSILILIIPNFSSTYYGIFSPHFIKNISHKHRKTLRN